jgi:hypothetical protein
MTDASEVLATKKKNTTTPQFVVASAIAAEPSSSHRKQPTIFRNPPAAGPILHTYLGGA